MGPALPNGDYEIELDNVDMDLYVVLDHSGGTVLSELQVVVDIDGVELEPGLSSVIENYVGDFETILDDYVGLSLNDLENMLEDGVEGGMADIATQVGDLVQDSVPAGHTICSMEVNGGQLELVTDDAGFRACLRYAFIGGRR